MKITNPQRMKLVAPLMAALLLSACGGDDSESLLSQPGANILPGVTLPGEGSDGFCTWPDEKGLADCGGEDGNGDGYGDEGDSNQNGVCEPGEYRTRDCDGLYVAPAEDGSIDAGQGSPMVSMEVTPSELTVYKMLTETLSAQATFENGQEKNVSGLVHWHSNDADVALVYDPQSEGYDGHRESVSVTGVEVGSTVVTAEGSTSEMTSSSLVSVETGTVNVDSVSVQFEDGNDTVTAGLTLQGYVEFELEEKPGETFSTLDERVDSAEFVTWSLSPAVDGISVDEHGLVTVSSPLTDEMLEHSPITLTADFIDEGLFGDVPTKEASFTVVLGEVTGTDVVVERNGVALTDSDTITRGDTLQGKAEVTFDDDSTYVTQDSTLVVWSVSPSDSGVTVDENGVVDTSGVDTSNGDVDVTIHWQGQGALSGQSGSETLSVTAPDFSTLAGGACGGQLNDDDPANAGGECLKIATADVNGQELWFTSTPSIAMMDSMGYTPENTSDNSGQTYAIAYSENGSYGPAGFDFARFRQDGQGGNTTTGEGGQFDRYCADLATRAFAGKSDWRRPTSSELTQLYNTHGNMWSALGWPTGSYYWSSTPNGSYFDYVYLSIGIVNSTGPSINSYASCVSGS